MMGLFSSPLAQKRPPRANHAVCRPGHCRGLTAGHFLGIAPLVGGSVVGIC